jgi:hypothetical protein
VYILDVVPAGLAVCVSFATEFAGAVGMEDALMDSLSAVSTTKVYSKGE